MMPADMNDEKDPFFNPENPEGLLAYGIWHKVAKLEGEIVLLELTMNQFRHEEPEEDEDEYEVLSLDDLSESWRRAALVQGAGLLEGEEILFAYPQDDEE